MPFTAGSIFTAVGVGGTVNPSPDALHFNIILDGTTGPFSGTVAFQAINDIGNAVTLQSFTLATSNGQASFTGPFPYGVRFNCTAFTSGTVRCNIFIDP